jgi:hypothetical protein
VLLCSFILLNASLFVCFFSLPSVFVKRNPICISVF